MSDALNLLTWFSTRNWSLIAQHPEVEKELTRRSLTAVFLLEAVEASLPEYSTPIILCCHPFEDSSDERPPHDDINKA